MNPPFGLWVQTWYVEGEVYNCFKTGVTGSSGTIYLECLIPPEYAEGLLFMQAQMVDPYYTVISSQDTWSNYQSYLYPLFEVVLDGNQNAVHDPWEMPLAQKFCPVLFAPYGDDPYTYGVGGHIPLRPIPVEAMDRDGPNGQPDGILDCHDVYVDLYNADAESDIFIGTYEMEDITVDGHSFSNNYPDMMEPVWLKGSYLLLPHFEWATLDAHEGNTSWYAVWDSLYSVNSLNSWYTDGTTYVSLDADAQSSNEVTIGYHMHYPFNASANRHEGDWPNIIITVSSQNPALASVVSVSYPFHADRTVRTVPIPYSDSAAEALAEETFEDDGNVNPAFSGKYFTVANTHPVSFGGGFIDQFDYEGTGSHAQYPCPGIWVRHFGPETVEEYVFHLGSINSMGVKIDFDLYQNIKIIPPKEYVQNNLRDDSQFNWLIFGGFWGTPRSWPSVDEASLVHLVQLVGLAPFMNVAPRSPYGGSL